MAIFHRIVARASVSYQLLACNMGVNAILTRQERHCTANKCSVLYFNISPLINASSNYKIY